jgi:hypothetical protein
MYKSARIYIQEIESLFICARLNVKPLEQPDGHSVKSRNTCLFPRLFHEDL